MSETKFATQQIVSLNEIEPCPIKITIHTAKKILSIEKTAKSSLESLPPLEVGILKNGKKYLIKRHSIFEALQRVGIKEYKANIHQANNLNDIMMQHVRMSQSSPFNPFAFLKLRDTLVKGGINPDSIADECGLDPAYKPIVQVKIFKATMNFMEDFIDMLSLRLSRVEIPPYVVEFLSKKSEDDQLDIVKRIKSEIITIAGSEDAISDKKFSFPTMLQLKSYQSTSTQRSATVFTPEEDIQETSKPTKTKTYVYSPSSKVQEMADKICGNNTHLGVVKIEKPGLYRVNMKDHVIAEIRNDKFHVIKDAKAIKNTFFLPNDHIEFLGIEGQPPFANKISTANQLRKLADKIENIKDFKAILISNHKV